MPPDQVIQNYASPTLQIQAASAAEQTPEVLSQKQASISYSVKSSARRSSNAPLQAAAVATVGEGLI
jgi:hypothetical protein